MEKVVYQFNYACRHFISEKEHGRVKCKLNIENETNKCKFKIRKTYQFMLFLFKKQFQIFITYFVRGHGNITAFR